MLLSAPSMGAAGSRRVEKLRLLKAVLSCSSKKRCTPRMDWTSALSWGNTRGSGGEETPYKGGVIGGRGRGGGLVTSVTRLNWWIMRATSATNSSGLL